MRIGIDATSWSNERGFGRFSRGLVRALATRDSGNSYTLLFDQAPNLPVPENVQAVIAGSDSNLNEASAGKSSRSGGYLWQMTNAARKLDVDLFFYPASYSWFPYLSRKPSIVCYHDTIPERFPDLIFPSRRNALLWRVKTAAACRLSTRAMTVSQASADDIHDVLGIPSDRIDIVTEGADDVFRPLSSGESAAETRAEFGFSADSPLLLYVGGFNRHKNVGRLIEAMSGVLQQRGDVQLGIVGRTTGDRFWDNVDELNEAVRSDARKSEQIKFTGEIDDTALASLLAACDALVFPSLWEGFGLPALEAMSCGTPVLASNSSSLPEILGGAGLLFDPRSTTEIAGAILQLVNDPELQKSLRTRALARAKNFNWDKGAALAEDSFRRAASAQA